jgi:uncharacterized membrane protein
MALDPAAMQKSQMLGRIFVAVSLAVFGIQHFMYGGFVAGLVPLWMPGHLFWAYFVGVAFFAAAAGILYKIMARPAATLLGAMFFLFLVLLHIPRIIGNSSDGNEWTSGFVALAMCGLAWALANASPLEEREKADPFLKLGRYFFALAFVAFGIQHFLDARLTIRVGPPWFPGRPLWAYLTGVVLIAAGIAIFQGKELRLAATLLGTMLLLFFLLIHLPRIVCQLHNPNPWTSGFEILAMCGGALAMAGTSQKQQR